ncbi:MAG: UTP--glucose-1-phosphate uridylyltransferase GalU [Bacillota bacterium]
MGARVRKAVIPAAGLGTRFLPATKAQPKEMLPLVDKPVIQYVVEEAIESGIEDILIVTGRGKRAIEDHFDRAIELESSLERAGKEGLLDEIRRIAEIDIHFIRQKQPLGLGHAVYQARWHVGNEPFAVMLGDEVFMGRLPALWQLMQFFESTGCAVLAVGEVPLEDVSKYGVVRVSEREPAAQAARGRAWKVTDLVEKPSPSAAPSRLAVMGRYVLTPEIFKILEHTPPGHNGEIQLTDALREYLKVGTIVACELDAERFDVGDKLGLIKATVELALRRPELAEPLRNYLKELVLSLG